MGQRLFIVNGDLMRDNNYEKFVMKRTKERVTSGVITMDKSFVQTIFTYLKCVIHLLFTGVRPNSFMLIKI